MTANELTEALKTNPEYTYPLACEMLKNIGHIDPELRDKLIYSTFWRWFSAGGVPNDDNRKILEIALDDNHLFLGLGEKDSDSVFTRSFSILVIALILSGNKLSAHEVSSVKSRVLEYIVRERDFRDYVEEKGWADARGHAADTLEALALSGKLSRNELTELLMAAKEMMLKGSVISCHEDDRFALAFVAVYKQNLLSFDEIMSYLMGFSDITKTGKIPYDTYRQINGMYFLRSVYFRLLDIAEAKEISEQLLPLAKYSRLT